MRADQAGWEFPRQTSIDTLVYEDHSGSDRLHIQCFAPAKRFNQSLFEPVRARIKDSVDDLSPRNLQTKVSVNGFALSLMPQKRSKSSNTF